MNPYVGLNAEQLVTLHNEWHRLARVADTPEERAAAEAEVEMIHRAADCLPSPARVGIVEVDVLEHDGDLSTVGIFERAAVGEGLEWSGPVAIFDTSGWEWADTEPKLVRVDWVAEGLCAAEARGACSIVDPRFKDAIEAARAALLVCMNDWRYDLRVNGD
jgi:hypothetical protein